jgi:hypothetical protein
MNYILPLSTRAVGQHEEIRVTCKEISLTDKRIMNTENLRQKENILVTGEK